MSLKKIGHILIPLSLLAISMPGMAASVCVTDIPGKGMATFGIDGYTPPEFTPFVPVGTVIDSRELEVTSANGQTVMVTCRQSGGARTVLNGRLTSAEPIYNTFPTSASGIGVRISFANNIGPSEGKWWPFGFNTSSEYVSIAKSPLRIEFVKTGPITAQADITGEIGGMWVDNNNFQMASYKINGSIKIRPRVPTCSVATKLVNVSMTPADSISSREFSGVGSTSPERDFSIRLNCTGGDPDTSTNAYVTLTDQTNNGNRSNQLSLTKDSTAKGVKVQILKAGKLLSYGPDSSAAGNPNQWKAGNIPRGISSFEIPLTARYIQTESSVKGGTANAVATFTMSYQ
ncbi:fimbrial protein [Burkholderia cepacia]|uniref:fimbrial protein n=1 Tax=Burkholderia cepacia TaxID=292 RepID=UPI000F5AD365|nr:fimbrial protein [Burkholderia cepacia]RQT68014.1 type 1 fimbrial protein [Burkholderia cepacia]